MRPLFIAYRSAGAILTVVAVVVQLQTSLGTWSDQGIQDVGTKLVNFFSFFTIQSNVVTAVTLAIGAVLLTRGGAMEPRWFGVLRACATTYIVTTGIVYNLLLRGIELPQGTTVPWTNEVLHVVVPIVMLVDWLFAPGRRRLGFGVVGIIVVYPIVWAAYTMIRGPLVQDELTGANWYPYPFLNPDTSENGYLTVALYVLLIAAIIGAAGTGVVAISRIRRGH
ncbi:MAG: Pr6Pr family membrane protein [Protaetiibacter sp.]